MKYCSGIHRLLPFPMLPLHLQLFGILNPKAMCIHLPHRLQRHIMHLRITEDDKHPADKANPSIETKRPARRHGLHHRQKRRRDDNVAAPAGHRVHHRAERADFQREELRANPCDWGDAGGEEGDVDDDGHKKEDTGPAHLLRLDYGEVVVDGNPVEGNGGDY